MGAGGRDMSLTCSVLGRVDKENAEGLGDRTKGPRFAPDLACLGLISRLLGLLPSRATPIKTPCGGGLRFGLTSLQRSTQVEHVWQGRVRPRHEPEGHHAARLPFLPTLMFPMGTGHRKA